MAKPLSLFDEEVLKSTEVEQPFENELNLPLIPLAKKKASKNDTPLEKEIRRFNKMIKELHDLEEANKKKEADEEKYNQLYNSKVVPALTEHAELRTKFAIQLENIFYSKPAKKSLEKDFVALMLQVLEYAFPYNETAKEMVQKYHSRQLSFLSNKERKQFKKAMNADGFNMDNTSFENFNFEDFAKGNFDNLNFSDAHFENASKAQHEQRKNESIAQKNIPVSLNELYKELVKLLHPDLEKDEKIKHEKQELMKELTAAKEAKDLHKMLSIKQKTLHFASGKKVENNYSLAQLKQFNKLLKEKLDYHKFQNRTDMIMENILGGNGSFKNWGNKKPVEEQINELLNNLKGNQVELNRDYHTITTYPLVLEFIQGYKDELEDMEMDAMDGFDFDSFF